MMKYVSIILCLVLIAACSLGCSSGKLATEAVTGTVTLDDQPLAGANVGFTSKDGQGHPGYALTDENGKYVLQTLLGEANAGTTAGEYAVTISKKESPEMKVVEYGSSGNQPMMGGSQPRETLPAIYTDPKMTPFSVSVEKGKNVHDFNLKSKP